MKKLLISNVIWIRILKELKCDKSVIRFVYITMFLFSEAPNDGDGESLFSMVMIY